MIATLAQYIHVHELLEKAIKHFDALMKTVMQGTYA